MKRSILIFLLLAFSINLLGNYCYGAVAIPPNSQEIIYDDYGKMITEDEIQKYMNPDVFWNTLRITSISTVVGMSIGVIYAVVMNNTGWGLMGYGVGGGILGVWLGFGYGSLFPPNKITRSEALNVIKQNRRDEKMRIDRY